MSDPLTAAADRLYAVELLLRRIDFCPERVALIRERSKLLTLLRH